MDVRMNVPNPASRLPVAAGMYPSVGSPAGSGNWAWFGRLKKSAENVSRVCSPAGILKSFCREKSRLSTPGFRTLAKNRGALPKALVTSQQKSPLWVELTKPAAGHVPEKSND